MGYQTAHVVSKHLKQASAILEPHDLNNGFGAAEFQGTPSWPISDWTPLRPTRSARQLIRRHARFFLIFTISRSRKGNLIPNIEACWDEIAYFQIGDNPGRKEPTTGEINYTRMCFKYIHEKGFDGVSWAWNTAIPGQTSHGEQAVIDAYKEVDAFL